MLTPQRLDPAVLAEIARLARRLLELGVVVDHPPHSVLGRLYGGEPDWARL